MLEIGSIIDGKYKVLNKIGQGGMSIVYLAINERANKTWAIKEIRKQGLLNYSQVRQRLIAETDILKQLSHPYLPSIVDVIDDGDTFLVVMDYIQGRGLNVVLQDRLNKEGRPIPVAEVISWGQQLCELLCYLHTRPKPIIYRDMKPSNIMLRPDGQICVVDFGTARIFKSQTPQDTACLGTPGYAAPEQYGGSPQSGPWTDIYNLGATLHHLVTGRSPVDSPFQFPKITQCRKTLIQETPKALRAQLLGLETVIWKSTQYEIRDRYLSSGQLQYDLAHLETLGLPYRKGLWRKMAAFMIFVFLSLTLGCIAVWSRYMEGYISKTGYAYYMDSALVSEEGYKLENYRKAIGLDPFRKEAYLKVLEIFMEDYNFSEKEETWLITVLNSRDYGRSQSNKLCLRHNQSGYVEFSYRLGLAYYYYAGGVGDRAAAAGWFKNVEGADLSILDFGENNLHKQAWKARATILGRIGSYYKSKLGVVDKAGDLQISYKDYWDDLLALFYSGLALKDNMVTQLRLYNEIVYEIFTWTGEFKDQGGITKAAMTQILKDLTFQLEETDNVQTEEELVKELKRTIKDGIKLAERNIEAVYGEEEEYESD